ncbi:hypothetical protein KCU67_g5025, partial [Aureobasidium melanogenum]
MATNYQAQIDEIMNRVAEIKKGLPPQPESKRTPGKLSFQQNAADQIEHALQADGHRIWGFVIYRCTYDSNEDWEFCMRHLHKEVRRNMDFYNGHDLLDEECFRLSVIENKSKFDGASTSTVRKHFHEWCAQALHREQGSEDEIASRQQKPVPWFGSLAVRYRFCLQIDAASLKSVVNNEDEAWINLINKDHITAARPGNDANTETIMDDNEEGEFTDDEDEEYPALEGNTEEDVGFMQVSTGFLMPDFYTYLWDPNAWVVSYCRPPTPATATATQLSAPVGELSSGSLYDVPLFYKYWDHPRKGTMESRDNCSAIEGMFAVSLVDLHKWIPSSKFVALSSSKISLKTYTVGSDCENLRVGHAYCAGGLGTSEPAAPTQSGVDTIIDGDERDKIKSLFNVTLHQLYNWDPAVGPNCTDLWLGYAVCVRIFISEELHRDKASFEVE